MASPDRLDDRPAWLRHGAMGNTQPAGWDLRRTGIAELLVMVASVTAEY
jgi:hypothetical protein